MKVIKESETTMKFTLNNKLDRDIIKTIDKCIFGLERPEQPIVNFALLSGVRRLICVANKIKIAGYTLVVLSVINLFV